MKILVLDDEPFVLKLLRHQLAGLGYTQVLAVESPREALGLLEDERRDIDLLIIDVQMPDIDGVEFVRHLERINYIGGLVLISGEDERILRTVEKLAKAHHLHVLGALSKPIRPEHLKQLLEHSPAHISGAWRVPRPLYGTEELRQAIANGELINHYQPQVEIPSGKVIAVEALVRWQHPEDGLVYPDQFIATAESSGLIDELTRVVLRNALTRLRRWLDEKLALKVAVNISMDNLTTIDFADFVAHEVEKFNVPLDRVVLEVTESQLMKDPLKPLDILTRLRLKHIGLSIDDFGTGHSSLAQLRDIPFDELKVDRGFIHGAHRYKSLRAIVEASFGMAQHLGMRTIAEGVEDQDDWDFLVGSSCDLAQGYFIAKPMPANDLSTWVSAWEARRFELASPGA